MGLTYVPSPWSPCGLSSSPEDHCSYTALLSRVSRAGQRRARTIRRRAIQPKKHAILACFWRRGYSKAQADVNGSLHGLAPSEDSMPPTPDALHVLVDDQGPEIVGV